MLNFVRGRKRKQEINSKRDKNTVRFPDGLFMSVLGSTTGTFGVWTCLQYFHMFSVLEGKKGQSWTNYPFPFCL